MVKTNINFLVFILVLFLICFLMNKNLNEKFASKFVESIDIFRTEPESELIKITKKSDETGWKNYYRKNYLKGNVEYNDNFKGTMIRNYLDNLNFIRN
jgi:hypothetical protein